MKKDSIKRDALVEFLRAKQEIWASGIMHNESADAILRARHRHDAYKELADWFEKGNDL